MSFNGKILFACFFASVLSIANLAYAQETISLDDIVVVSAYRTETSLSDVADNVVVLDQADIEALPASSVSDLLSYAPGIDIQTGVGFGRDIKYSTYGSDVSKDQVRVMIDGIPLNNQAQSQVPLNRLSSAHISQVEVMSGASSALWGSGFGGMVNLVSKNPSKDKKIEVRARTLFGELRKRQELLEMSGTVKKFSHYSLVEYLSSGSEKNKDDTSETRTYNKFKYDFDDAGTLTAVYGYDSGSINSGYDVDDYLYYRKYRQKYGKLAYAIELGEALYKAELKFSRFNETFFNNYGDYLNIKAKHYQTSLSADYAFREKDHFLIGVDMDWESVKSPSYDSVLTAQAQAPYLSYLFSEGNLDVHVGLRYDHSKQFEDQVNPSLGFVYSFEDKFDSSVRSRVARAYNYPKLSWQRLASTSNPYFTLLDNYDLRPETAIVGEFGFKTHPSDKLMFDFGLYISDIKNYIDQENDFGAMTKQWVNKKKYRKQGISLRMEYDIMQQLIFSADASFHRVEDRVARKRVDQDHLRMMYNLGLTYRGMKGLNLGLFSRYSYWPADYAGSWENPNDRKFIFDLKTEKKFEKFSVFFNVHNLTNSKYWHNMYEKYPERYFEGGIELNW